jgi:hypothetical protein
MNTLPSDFLMTNERHANAQAPPMRGERDESDE